MILATLNFNKIVEIIAIRVITATPAIIIQMEQAVMIVIIVIHANMKVNTL